MQRPAELVPIPESLRKASESSGKLLHLNPETNWSKVRKNLPKCYFDKEKTYQGVEALKAYQKKWDEKNQCFKNRPIHNFASHPSDAFRYGCTFVGGRITDWKKQIEVNTSYII